MRAWVWFFSVLCCWSLESQASLLKPYKDVLANKLQIVVLEDHRTPAVDILVGYKVGAADDPLAKTGLAHFLEHLMFKGIPGLEENEFFQAITRLGGHSNATTSFDYTLYTTTIPKQHLEKVLAWEAKRMEKLTLTEDMVKRERDVVLEERSQRFEGNHAANGFEVLLTQLYWHHPYRHTAIGWEHEIKTFSLADALAFHAQWYAPNNAVVVFSGDITPAEAMAAAQKHFGALRERPINPRKRVAEPMHPRGLRSQSFFHDARVKQPSLLKFFSVTPYTQETKSRNRARDVLSALLNDGKTSFLHQVLVETKKVARWISINQQDSLRDYGHFEIEAAPRDGVSLAQLEEELNKALRDYLKQGPTAQETKRVTQRLGAGLQFKKDNISACAQDLATLLASEVDIGLLLNAKEEWEDVKPDQVKAELQTLLETPNQTTLYLLPLEEKQ